MKNSMIIRTGIAVLAFSTATWLGAQSTPSSPKAKTSSTQSATATKQGAWVMFNAEESSRLQLKDEQLQRLQEVDKRYNQSYRDMGDSPWTDPDFPTLNERRNNDVKEILTPEQYDSWNRNNGMEPVKAPNPTPGNKVGTTPAKPKP